MGVITYWKEKENNIPKKTSQLTNDSGFLTSHQDISGKEDTTNKITSISSSSTNTQYTSGAAVYNYVNTTITNLLEASY